MQSQGFLQVSFKLQQWFNEFEKDSCLTLLKQTLECHGYPRQTGLPSRFQPSSVADADK